MEPENPKPFISIAILGVAPYITVLVNCEKCLHMWGLSTEASLATISYNNHTWLVVFDLTK